MLSRIFGWLFYSATLLSWAHAMTCEAPSGTNFSDQPDYWCSLDARVSVSTGCDIAVEEIIKVPWTTGVLDRSVPTEDSQILADITAYRLLNGIRTSSLPATQKSQAQNNRLLSIQVGQFTEPVSVLIMYKKIGGVQAYSQCSGLAKFKPVANSEAKTVMLTEWAVGGTSISDLQHVAVKFFLRKDQKLEYEYIDTQPTLPKRFKRGSLNNVNAASDQVIISYSGSTAGLSPSQLMFYIRYYMPLGAQTCFASRNCEYESMILGEGQSDSSNVKQRIIIGACFTLVLIAVGASLTALILHCKKIKDGQQVSNVEEVLPESLRHFEYDTGADQMEEKKADDVWMSNKSNEGNEMKEEFYALDLSPRNRGKKDSERF